jgi:hypothetical protein
MKFYFVKHLGQILNDEGVELSIFIKKKFGNLPEGALFELEIKSKRNPLFHRKYFALLKIGFDAVDFGDHIYKGQLVKKNPDSFRSDIAILCGFCEPEFKYDGSFRMKAKSISFAKMEQEEFEELFSQTINILLEKILPKSYNDSKLRKSVDEILNQFT